MAPKKQVCGRRSRSTEVENTHQRKAMQPGDYYTPVRPLNPVQAEFLDSIRRNAITFGTGSAGTGKTKLAVGFAAEELYFGRIDKIYLLRPAVTVDEDLGFLPGELEDKYAPFFRPFKEHLNKIFRPNTVELLRSSGVIQALPIGHCRGLTFGGDGERAVVIIDEAQNVTPDQMMMLLTRIGPDCKMIFTGDERQSDLSDSGLMTAVKLLRGMKGVAHIAFTLDSCVRGPFCKEILRRFETSGFKLRG